MEENIDVDKFTREQASQWLKTIGLGASGTRDELLTRIKLFIRSPWLIEKIRKRTENNYKFKCSLDPLEIPPNIDKWTSDETKYPVMNNDLFKRYLSHKTEGSSGQQEKAVRMLQSRKVVNVKTLNINSTDLFVKALIKKSYGQEMRPAVILFRGDIPTKSHCPCPVGSSGLCSHIFCLLLFLKHFTDTKEKLLELTCTEKLQTWHRRIKKGSIPMVPLRNIKLKSAKMKKKNGNITCSAADPNKSYFKRDTVALIANLKNQLRKEKPVTEHFYEVLRKYKSGCNSSVGQYLIHKFEERKALALADHDYLAYSLFDKEIIKEDSEKLKKIHQIIDSNSTVNEKSFEDETATSKTSKSIDFIIDREGILYNKNDPTVIKIREEIRKQMLDTSCDTVNVDLTFQKAPKPCGSNYHNVKQNTDEWHKLRKFKITGSRFAYLIGMQGKKKFDEYWEMIETGHSDKGNLSHLKNIQRGHQYESKAVTYFEKLSNSKTEICGFFTHPTNPRYGASPDALGAASFLIEVKTRAQNTEGPLDSLKSVPHYYLQCQLQIACTDAEFCILVSYHPETDTGNFFLVVRNNPLLEILQEICDCIISKRKIIKWNHCESKELQSIGENLIGKELDFDTLKPIRRLVNNYVKTIKKVTFKN